MVLNLRQINYLQKASTNWINQLLKKPKRRKVYSLFKDNIWCVDLADMQLLSKCNKGIRFLLCVIDIFNKYAWVAPLKDKNIETILLEDVLLIGLKFLKLKKIKTQYLRHMVLLISMVNELLELFMISFNLNFVDHLNLNIYNGILLIHFKIAKNYITIYFKIIS